MAAVYRYLVLCMNTIYWVIGINTNKYLMLGTYSMHRYWLMGACTRHLLLGAYTR